MSPVAEDLGLHGDPADSFSVRGKTALVTGASSGIGKTLAARLSEQGCNVVLAARKQHRLQEVCREIARMHNSPASAGPEAERWSHLELGQAQLLELDVSLGELEIDHAVEAAWNAFGGLDIVINNAGTTESALSPHVHTTYERSQEDWDRVLRTNLRGAGLVATAAAKRMVAADRPGSIINIASTAGLSRGLMPNNGIYAASKAALIQYTKALALELGPHRIRVNAIAPGLFESELSAQVWERFQHRASEKVPLQRWGLADPDLTAPVLLLGSDAGSYITGTTFVVDGGLSLKTLTFET